MKKSLINFLIIVFLSFSLLPKFALSQLPFLEYVPVIDEKAVRALGRVADVLDSLLTLTTEELQKLNTQIAHILDNQIKEQANQIVTDVLKEMTYQEYIAEVKELIKKHEIKEPAQIEKDLKEARMAGAYLGLEEFTQKTHCLNPRLRNEITNFASILGTDYDLSRTAQDFLQQIPDCQETYSLTPSSLSLRLKIFSPFNLGSFLAQLRSPTVPSPEIPEIVIQPAFQETEDTLETSEIKNSLQTTVLARINQKEEERKKELAEVRPLYETCLREAFTDSDVICLEKKTVISLNELKKSLENKENPLLQSFEDKNIYRQLASSQNVLTKLGLTTSSLSSPTDLAPSTTTFKEIIDESCADYLKDKPIDELSSAYVRCLKIFNEKIDNLAKIQKEKLDSIKKQAEENQKRYNDLAKKAEELKDEVRDCDHAYNNLEALTQELGSQAAIYLGIFNEINKLSNQLLPVINQIKNLSSQLDSLLNQIFNSSFEVISTLNSFLDLFKSILNIFGLDLNLPIISDLLNKLKDIKTQVLPQVQEFINKFNQVLDKQAGVIYDFNRFYFDLNKANISRASILSDLYKAEEIAQKLEAYQRLAESGKCSSQSENLSAMKKPMVIVVKGEEGKKSNFSWLKKFFGSNLVEINF